MTNTAILTVRTDPKIKKAAQKAAKELGVPLSVVINASLRDFVREGRIELVPSQKLCGWIEEDRKEQSTDKGKKFSSVSALLADLDS